MAKYIVRRLLLGILTFFGITVIVFFMSYLVPGSPLDYLLADLTISAEKLICTLSRGSKAYGIRERNFSSSIRSNRL